MSFFIFKLSIWAIILFIIVYNLKWTTCLIHNTVLSFYRFSFSLVSINLFTKLYFNITMFAPPQWIVLKKSLSIINLLNSADFFNISLKFGVFSFRMKFPGQQQPTNTWLNIKLLSLVVN